MSADLRRVWGRRAARVDMAREGLLGLAAANVLVADAMDRMMQPVLSMDPAKIEEMGREAERLIQRRASEDAEVLREQVARGTGWPITCFWTPGG